MSEETSMKNNSDPRFKNRFYPAESITSYCRGYATALAEAYQRLDQGLLQRFASEIEAAIRENRTIFTCGNGGSATIADQMAADWGKGIYIENVCAPKVICLASNLSSVTAYGNDVGYDYIFSEQLKMLAKANDVYLAISSSGNSPNVIEGASTAKRLGMRILSFTGFSGGRLKDLSDISLHVPIDNYGVVEDCHQGIMHLLAQYLFLRFHASMEQERKILVGTKESII